MLISKEIYKFLKHFKRVADRNKRKDETCKLLKIRKITIEQLINLFKMHKNLNPSSLFELNENFIKSDYQKDCVEHFIKETGLEDLIIIEESSYVSMTQLAAALMDNYKKEYYSKIRLPWIAIIISFLSILISIISMFLDKIIWIN